MITRKCVVSIVLIRSRGFKWKEYIMKIRIEASQVLLQPENEEETGQLDALWKLVLRCDADSLVLCPVGSYVPGTDEAASFLVQEQ